MSTAALLLETITKFVASDAAFQRHFREARIIPVLARLLSGFAEAAEAAPHADGSEHALFHPHVLASMFQPEAGRSGAADADALPTALDAYGHLCRCVQAMLDGNAQNRLQFLHTCVHERAERPASAGLTGRAGWERTRPAAAAAAAGCRPTTWRWRSTRPRGRWRCAC